MTSNRFSRASVRDRIKTRPLSIDREKAELVVQPVMHERLPGDQEQTIAPEVVMRERPYKDTELRGGAVLPELMNAALPGARRHSRDKGLGILLQGEGDRLRKGCTGSLLLGLMKCCARTLAHHDVPDYGKGVMPSACVLVANLSAVPSHGAIGSPLKEVVELEPPIWKSYVKTEDKGKKPSRRIKSLSLSSREMPRTTVYGIANQGRAEQFGTSHAKWVLEVGDIAVREAETRYSRPRNRMSSCCCDGPEGFGQGFSQAGVSSELMDVRRWKSIICGSPGLSIRVQGIL
ncbi:hypothetical protein K474DRAFT_1672162 [Panus rudis PR-1116 ss-1]|nr:hypothetical protein K474DRAFT_1672162 [Panus rudis PR-1116 ss-1]